MQKFELTKLAKLIEEDEQAFTKKHKKEDMDSKVEQLMNKTNEKKMMDLLKKGQNLEEQFKSIKYLNKSVFRTSDKYYYCDKKGTLVGICTKNFNDTFCSKFGILETYIKKNAYFPIYTTICDPSKKAIDMVNHELNYVPEAPFEAKKYTKNDFVELFLKFTRDICGSDEIYSFLLNWVANLVQGKKNDVCIYLYSRLQGVGKSCFVSTIAKMMGRRALFACIDDGATYTGKMKGRPLIIFEEIPEKQSDKYHDFNENLKNMITNDIFSYTQKYEVADDTACVNNFLMSANVLLDNHVQAGRRHFVLHLVKKWEGNFAKIYDGVKEEQNLQQLYNYFSAIDTSKFSAQRDMPTTTIKGEIVIASVPTAFKFLRDVYMKKRISKDIKRSELYEKYVENEDYGFRKASKVTFNQDLREMGLQEKTLKGYDYWCIDHEKIFNYMKEKQFLSNEDIHEYTNIIETKEEGKIADSIQYDTDENLKALLKKKDDRIAFLEKELERLKAKFEGKEETEEQKMKVSFLELVEQVDLRAKKTEIIREEKEKPKKKSYDSEKPKKRGKLLSNDKIMSKLILECQALQEV